MFSQFLEFTNWRTADDDNDDDGNDEVDVDDADADNDDDDDGDSIKLTVQDFDTGESRAWLIRGALRVTARKLIRTLINIEVLIWVFQNDRSYDFAAYEKKLFFYL